MSKRSFFGLEPDQLARLLSLGTEVADGADAAEPDRGPSDQGNAPQPPAEGLSVPTLDVPLEHMGSCVGPYRLVSVLGEGGMGTVYLADQTAPIRRRVALKVIKPGMDSARVVARFEAERQALALLDHPNIAHVYDAGTTDNGRPYFVMEHIKGLPLSEYCDRHKLSIEDRLRLFQQVCHGVQHAHQKGIIHRDIKPSNILVSTEGDEAIPNIIDFGVAKAISQPLTERTLVTEDSHLLGTPEYMSPEQADLTNEDVDTRSDVYSLGVLLYELLAGILPYDSQTFREGGIEGIRRTIRETDPKTPSTRLTKLGEEAQKLAESRRTEVAALAKKLHRELEWIPLKAMRKERAERYRSASELADDIENYLNGAPLIAGPPSTRYKLKKFVRRNRALVGGTAALSAVLVGGVVVSTLFAIRADRARAEAQLIADFLEEDVLGSAGKAKIGEATVEYVLDAASKHLERRLKDRPLVEASIRRRLSRTYREIGESDKAEQHLLRAMEICRQHHGEEHPNTLAAMDLLGYIYEDLGRYRDMERLGTRMFQIRQDAYGEENLRGAMNLMAVAKCHLGQYEEAESLFNKMLQSERAWYEQGGRGFNAFPHFRCNLARVYTAKGRYEAAEQLLRKAIPGAGFNVEYGVSCRYTTELANVYRDWGQYDKAEPLYNRTLEALRQTSGNEHFLTLLCMCGLVRLYVDQDRYQEAQTLFGETLPIARRRLREDHPVTLRLVNACAVFHTKQKQYDEAEGLFDEALKGRQRELGEDHPEALQTLNDFGVLRREQHRHEEAESLLRQALGGRQRKLGQDHPACFETMHELGVLYIAQSRYKDAEPLLLDAFHGRETKLGSQHPHTVESLKQLVTLYESWTGPEEAAKWRAKLPQTDSPEE